MITEMQLNIKKNILATNELAAEAIRQQLAGFGIKMYNLIGSPGAGKTALLEQLIPACRQLGKRIAVIEGDCHTDLDAERIAKTGVPVLQINTGSGCHLDALMIQTALREFDLGQVDMLLIENVGNLVCPSEFDLGETAKIAVISTTEGADKPGKYPMLFHQAKMVVLTKTDLIPHTNFQLSVFQHYLDQIQQNLKLVQVNIHQPESFQELARQLSLH